MIYDNPDQIAELFKLLNCVVVKCEMTYNGQLGGEYEYMALSPKFREIQDGHPIPEYNLVLKLKEVIELASVERLPDKEPVRLVEIE